MPAPLLAALAGRVGVAEAGTYALAGEAAGGVEAKAATKQAANSLVSVSDNLKKTDKAAKDVAKGGGANYLDHLKEARSQYQQAAGHLQSVTSKIQSIGVTVAAVLTAGIVSLQALADPIAQLTGLSNPAALDAFTRAVNDDFAVVGRALLPITEAFTRAFQKLGNYLAGAEPILNTVAQAFAHMIDVLGDQWLDAARESGPLLEAVADVLLLVAKNATVAGSALLAITKSVQKILGATLGLLGYTGSSFNKDASAKGAAVRTVTVGNSAEEVSRKAQEAALRQALNPGAKTAADLPTVVGGMSTVLQEIADNVSALVDFVSGIADAVDGLGGGVGEAAAGAVGAASDAADSVGRLLKSALLRW